MRQGFGRLMRKQDDRGVVVILDSRIVSRAYGRVFFESLPETRRAIATESEVLAAVSVFFGSENEKGGVD
jgi:ATP-dependent DNA helicase DinG